VTARSARGSSSISRGARHGAIALLALLLGGWAGTPARAAEKAPTPAEEAARLTRENLLLQKEVDLASGNDFYMVLDPRDHSLRVMLQGVTLRRYELKLVRFGVPRVLYRKSGAPKDWQDRIWSDPKLEPPRARDRLEIVATGDSTTMPEPPIPLTPEEAFPAPANYRIRYSGGLALDVRSETPPPPASLPDSLREDTSLMGRLRAWVKEARSVLTDEGRDALRLQIVMRNEDAAALYRSMPPGTRLLVLVHAPAGP
jgi:hypothetical protein